MSFSVQLGLLFALATAVTSIVGFLLKYRGADESPAVTLRNPVKSSLALFKSRWYTIGIIVATASWGLHVAALSLAPISIVQSVIAGGLVLLTVIADRVFGYEVTRREWICVWGKKIHAAGGWGGGAAGGRPRFPRGNETGPRGQPPQRLRPVDARRLRG